MAKATDIQVVGCTLYFLPVRTRVPLKFGPETLTEVVCARARVKVSGVGGKTAHGWGETPLSVQWVWPGRVPMAERQACMQKFCVQLAELWPSLRSKGHPMEITHDFVESALAGLLDGFNATERAGREPMPWLAALLCASVFDLATHDAYGHLHDVSVYDTYTKEWLNRDLAHYVQPATGSSVSFRGKYPRDFLAAQPRKQMLAWHLIAGLDPIEPAELTGNEPADGYPVLLTDWVERDGLKCLKVKLRGNDPAWDYRRLAAVGKIAIEHEVSWLSADFNCTVQDPEYVNEILDRVRDEHPRIYGMLLYVEQPFPYDLEANAMDVRSLSGRKPLFLDESAHDWRVVRLGRELGWTGVALKTCKTQTGAILSGCWAAAHGMGLMVQDLTNPMLAQITHLLLAAHFPTIMGVETNSMQFYPEASLPEAAVHPGAYQRREGLVDLRSITGSGFGYRIEEIKRELPEPVAQFER